MTTEYAVQQEIDPGQWLYEDTTGGFTTRPHRAA